jgi:hypothetical protein
VNEPAAGSSPHRAAAGRAFQLELSGPSGSPNAITRRRSRSRKLSNATSPLSPSGPPKTSRACKESAGRRRAHLGLHMEGKRAGGFFPPGPLVRPSCGGHSRGKTPLLRAFGRHRDTVLKSSRRYSLTLPWRWRLGVLLFSAAMPKAPRVAQGSCVAPSDRAVGGRQQQPQGAAANAPAPRPRVGVCTWRGLRRLMHLT